MSDVDRTLIAAGFSWRGGQLQPGGGSDPLVRLAPVRDRYQVTISVAPAMPSCSTCPRPRSESNAR
jgi:hypothetical protein